MSGDRTLARVIPARPPDAAFFAAARSERLGVRAARVTFQQLAIAFDGMDDAWHADFLKRYAPWSGDLAGDAAPTLTLEAGLGETEHYVEPPPPGVTAINPVAVAVDDAGPGRSRLRVCTFGLAATFATDGGRGRAIFARTRYDPRERAVENILRVATAWLAVARGGLLMHSASIVKDGAAWLFFGQSGAGKSTLAALSDRGQVISDDLTLILPGPGGHPHAVGTPFRGTYAGGPPLPGAWPVRAAFRLAKARGAERAEVTPVRRSLANAMAIANLPFLVDQLHARPDLFAGVEQVFSAFPVMALRFRKDDPSFWDAIETAGL